MKEKINLKRAIIAGLVVLLIHLVIGNLLWMNPISMNISKQFENHPTMKPFDFIGGMVNWIIANSVFGIILTLVFIFIFIVLYRSIPGKGWVKGLFYGFMLCITKAIPEAFNQWMLFIYPEEMILMQLVITIISLFLFSLILAFMIDKFKVFNKGSLE